VKPKPTSLCHAIASTTFTLLYYSFLITITLLKENPSSFSWKMGFAFFKLYILKMGYCSITRTPLTQKVFAATSQLLVFLFLCLSTLPKVTLNFLSKTKSISTSKLPVQDFKEASQTTIFFF